MLKRFYYIALLALAVFLGSCSQKSGLPDLTETYEHDDTRPFGGYISYHTLQHSYPKHSIQMKRGPFTETAAWIVDTASLYVNISRKYYVSESDADALLDYVYKGNTAFIASSEIDSVLLKRLFCRQFSYDEKKSFFRTPMTNTPVSLVPSVKSAPDSVFKYYYYSFNNYFSELNDRYCRIVGYNEFKKPNFIVFFWGKGRFYLHCDPRAFSNYFLLQNNNAQYLFQPLRILPADPEHIFWDDYYNKMDYRDNDQKESLLSALFRHPPLKAAFWLMLVLLLLYILLNGKRRQRIIPIIKPVQNSSVAFAEAIAGVYMKERNNKMMVEKMTNYFNESIRSRFYLNTNLINNDFLSSLSKKANVPLEKTENLYQSLQRLAEQKKVTDAQLLDLNEQIQQFNKYKK